MAIERDMAYEKLAQKYRNVFSTPEGQEVLKDLIWNQLGIFRCDKKAESDIVLSNVGMAILDLIGNPNPKINIDNIVSSLLARPKQREREI